MRYLSVVITCVLLFFTCCGQVEQDYVVQNRNRGYTIVGVEFDIKDLDSIAFQKVNLVRYMLFKTEDWKDSMDFGEYSAWLDSELMKLDIVLAKCAKLGIRVCIDLHSVPGNRYENGSQRLFYNQELNNQYIEVWKKIAARYKANQNIYGFGLMNEPVLTEDIPIVYDHIETQSRAAEAIREIDSDIPVIFSSDNWNNSNPFFDAPLSFENIIYEVHMYDRHSYTHQGVMGNTLSSTQYPEDFNKEDIRELFSRVRKFQLKYDAKIFVGEFSVVRWAEGGADWLKDSINLFEEYGWDWTYHSWTPNTYWSLDYKNGIRNDLPVIDPENTDRKKVVLHALKRNVLP